MKRRQYKETIIKPAKRLAKLIEQHQSKPDLAEQIARKLVTTSRGDVYIAGNFIAWIENKARRRKFVIDWINSIVNRLRRAGVMGRGAKTMTRKEILYREALAQIERDCKELASLTAAGGERNAWKAIQRIASTALRIK